MHVPTDRITHTTTFDGPVVDHWLERKMAQTVNASTVQDRSDDPNPYKCVLYCLSYVPLPLVTETESKGTCLLLLYVITTSTVISRRVPTRDSAHSLRFCSAVPLGNQATSTMT